MKNLADLIFPLRCIGCSQLGISICSACRKNWHPHIYHRNLNVLSKNYPVISAIEYSSVASAVILRAKESSQAIADELVVNAIAHSLRYFAKSYGTGVLVAIPSRRSATRKRGRDFMKEITRSVATCESFDFFEMLQHQRAVRDQSQLNSQQRMSNIAGAFSIFNNLVKVGDFGNTRPLILVDDLVTTGATLAEAIRALRTAGFEVLGAVTGAVANPYDKGVDFRKGR
jgi:predicted amidophosphoribosyltransferase